MPKNKNMVQVELDKPRRLFYNHTTIVKMDDELGRRYNTNFQEFVMSASEGFHFGCLITAYKWAMRVAHGRLSDDEVAKILDRAELSFEDLLMNLVEAHPYMQLEIANTDDSMSLSEDEDDMSLSLGDAGTSDPTEAQES